MCLHEDQVPNPNSNLDHNPHGRGLSLDLNPVCLRVNATKLIRSSPVYRYSTVLPDKRRSKRKSTDIKYKEDILSDEDEYLCKLGLFIALLGKLYTFCYSL